MVYFHHNNHKTKDTLNPSLSSFNREERKNFNVHTGIVSKNKELTKKENTTPFGELLCYSLKISEVSAKDAMKKNGKSYYPNKLSYELIINTMSNSLERTRGIKGVGGIIDASITYYKDINGGAWSCYSFVEGAMGNHVYCNVMNFKKYSDALKHIEKETEKMLDLLLDEGHIDLIMSISKRPVEDVEVEVDVEEVRQLKVLIACEESQAITKVFREMGHEAFSCDIKECSGGHPEWHIQDDALKVANEGDWDLMIAHPPCTYLTVSGNRWFYHPEDKHLPIDERRPHPKFPDRRKDQKDAYDFFVALSEVDVPHIAIENPVGVIPTLLKKEGYEGWLLNKPQYIQPYWFGDKVSKKTGFWCKGLPLLTPTIDEKDWDKGEMTESGMSKWYSDALKAKTAEERRTIRSKTHPKMARAIAEQWANHILKGILLIGV